MKNNQSDYEQKFVEQVKQTTSQADVTSSRRTAHPSNKFPIIILITCTYSIVKGAAVILDSQDQTSSEKVVYYDGYYVLNKQVSNFIGSIFEYNIQTLAVLVLISFAISTCVYNKLACGYLGINLAEKSYFDFELYPEYIYAICIVNILICGFFCYKGLRILTSSRKQ